MNSVADYPLLVFLLSFFAMSFSTWVGGLFIQRLWALRQDIRDDFTVILTPTLTLLGLLIAFSFSMAISRYDQRKNYEAEEANAIGTEYVRADLLPAADAAKVRALLRDYIDQRILRYSTRDVVHVGQINARTAQLQTELWAAVLTPAMAQPTPMSALAVSGMNDVLNSQGYTQAARWNRIPIAAWMLMIVVAMCCNMLIGYGTRNFKAESGLVLILPFVVSISFFLIADIDSPRGGVIHVNPQNLESLADSLRPR